MTHERIALEDKVIGREYSHDSVGVHRIYPVSREENAGGRGHTLAAAEFGMIGSAGAQDGKAGSTALPTTRAGTHTSFASLKQIDAGVLNVGYAEVGPANGPAGILLHGWPYDIHSYVDVAPALASTGYRAIIPHLRGYGTTRSVDDG